MSHADRPFPQDYQKAWDKTYAGAHEELVRALTRLKQAFLKPWKELITRRT